MPVKLTGQTEKHSVISVLDIGGLLSTTFLHVTDKCTRMPKLSFLINNYKKINKFLKIENKVEIKILF
jgi:hypothetical protein